MRDVPRLFVPMGRRMLGQPSRRGSGGEIVEPLMRRERVDIELRNRISFFPVIDTP